MIDTRKRDWILTIRLSAEVIDDVRRAYAATFGGDWRDVSRRDVEAWALAAWEGELEDAGSVEQGQAE